MGLGLMASGSRGTRGVPEQFSMQRLAQGGQSAQELGSAVGAAAPYQNLQRLNHPGLSGFYGSAQLANSVSNRTEEVTSILKQLAGGADPRSLGLVREQERESVLNRLSESQDNFFQGRRTGSPFDRVFEGLLSRQASQGFGFGSQAVQARQNTGDPVSAVAALRAGAFGKRGNFQLQTPEFFNMLTENQRASFMGAQEDMLLNTTGRGDVGHARRQREHLGTRERLLSEGRVSIFNPPPFFNIL